jgi:hypothetical protein
MRRGCSRCRAVRPWLSETPVAILVVPDSLVLVTLPDGRVLSFDGTGRRAAILDVSAGMLHTVPPPVVQANSGLSRPCELRCAPGATLALLRDGQILVAGGGVSRPGDVFHPRDWIRSAQIFDPSSATWRPTGDMTVPRDGFTMIVLKDGRVFATGGLGAALGTAELYDPTLGTWSATAPIGRP